MIFEIKLMKSPIDYFSEIKDPACRTYQKTFIGRYYFYNLSRFNMRL